MAESINLAEARKNLPELADRAFGGHSFILARRGRKLAAIIGIDEYNRLKELEEQERRHDFELLLAPPGQEMLNEEDARQLAARAVEDVRSRRYAERPAIKGK